MNIFNKTSLDYLTFFKRFHRNHNFDTYFEIGTATGRSLVPARNLAISVDPKYRIDTNIFKRKLQLHLFQMTSDAFFETKFLDKNKIRIDFAFLDGMHLFEYLLRDFINAERYMAEDSYIALHDCCPSNSIMTSREKIKGMWTGDVWKLVPILLKYRPDLDISILDCTPTGIVLIKNLNPSSKVLHENYDKIVEDYLEVDLETYNIEKYYDLFDIVNSRGFLN